MSKRFPKKLLKIPVCELEKLHTGSLLTRLKRLRALDENLDSSDLKPEEYLEMRQANFIVFKDEIAWRDAFRDVKTILATREHVERRSTTLMED